MTLVWRDAANRIPPGSFAFVMATGIVSTAQSLTGWTVLSLVFLFVTVAGLLVLAVLTILRVVLFRRQVADDLRDPGRAFGFFTVVAALDVLAARLVTAGHSGPAAVLAWLSVPCWLLLTYGLPTGFFLRSKDTSVSRAVDGSWLLWVVGTQAVAIVAGAAARTRRSSGLADAAVALWGIGVALYAVLTVLILWRLLTIRSIPETFAATYWILLGATAISVLAGARILQLPPTLPILSATGAVVSGTSYLLWAFGTWWIPFLVIFGVWRYLMRRATVRYKTALWSIVFPLGMYSTASMTFGSTTKLSFMVAIGQIRTWIATLAWLAVFAVACHAAIRRLRTERQGRELPPTSSTTTPLSATANATAAPARPAGRSSTPTASERHPTRPTAPHQGADPS